MSTINPKIPVTLHDGEVIVHDLPWTDALRFIKLLAGHAKELIADATSAGGKFDALALLPKLENLVVDVEELSTFLITKSTGKTEEWLLGTKQEDGTRTGGRHTLEVMELLSAALEANLSDELLSLAKKVGDRLGRVMSPKTSDSRPSATS